LAVVETIGTAKFTLFHQRSAAKPPITGESFMIALIFPALTDPAGDVTSSGL
jgi:hypothetical protein